MYTTCTNFGVLVSTFEGRLLLYRTNASTFCATYKTMTKTRGEITPRGGGAPSFYLATFSRNANAEIRSAKIRRVSYFFRKKRAQLPAKYSPPLVLASTSYFFQEWPKSIR